MSRGTANLTRVSVMAGTAAPGRFGADKGAPGVMLKILHPVSLLHVTARADQSKAVWDGLKRMGAVTVMWAGPDQYFVKSADHVEGALASELKRKLQAKASIVDQSHSRVLLRLIGPKARHVLAKGTPVDLHPDLFPIGHSAVTQMAHVGVHLTRVGEEAFELLVFRGFAESFWDWLCEMSLEFGYQVLESQ